MSKSEQGSAALLLPLEPVLVPGVSSSELETIFAKVRMGEKLTRAITAMPKQNFLPQLYHRGTTTRDARDTEILSSLDDTRPTLWGHPFSLVSKQLNGETGALSLESCNIFYMEGIADPVDFDWCSDPSEWMAELYEFDCRVWAKGRRVFSRSST